MHRLRVGAIGLACVFLLVMLASAVLRMANGDDVMSDNAEVAANMIDRPSEPLAELGVAPGNPGPDPAPAVPAPAPR